MSEQSIPQIIELADGTKCVRLEDFLRDRDEAVEEIKEWETLCLWGGTPEHIHGFIRGQQSRIQHLERERDEAFELLASEKITRNHIIKRSVEVERERDEAREDLKHIGEYGTEEINAAVELRQKLATALLERDEAREKYATEATEHMLAVNKLCNERDEAREDADHWKIEYEIVVSRLCGVKHDRDNGVIFEHEIIPKLQRERDEALEKLSATWQSLRDSQDEVLRLTFENRELRNLSNE